MTVTTAASPSSSPRSFHILGADGDYLIAVNDIAVFIDCKESVGVAVECEACHKSVLNDIFLKILEVSRAAVVIDIDAVRLVCEASHSAPICMKRDSGAVYARRAVGAVEAIFMLLNL